MSTRAFLAKAQAEMDSKFPAASNGGKCPCLAMAWGKPSCNFAPCMRDRDHGAPKDEHKRFAATLARKYNWHETHSDWVDAGRPN